MEGLVNVARKRLAQKKLPVEVIDRMLTPERVDRLGLAAFDSEDATSLNTLFEVLDEVVSEYSREVQGGILGQMLQVAAQMGLPTDRIKELGERLLEWQRSHEDVLVSQQLQAFMNFVATGKDESGLGLAEVFPSGAQIFGCECDFDDEVLPPEAERITVEVAIPDSTGLGVLATEHIERLFYYGEDNPPRSGCHWRGIRQGRITLGGTATAPTRSGDPVVRTSEIPDAVLDTVLELLTGVGRDLRAELTSRQHVEAWRSVAMVDAAEWSSTLSWLLGRCQFEAESDQGFDDQVSELKREILAVIDAVPAHPGIPEVIDRNGRWVAVRSGLRRLLDRRVPATSDIVAAIREEFDRRELRAAAVAEAQAKCAAIDADDLRGPIDHRPL
jgi:hypothetical protein